MAIALFGGTFDPVHFGHLRIATELAERLQLERIRLIPCAFPPHRDQPDASPEQRLAMLNEAVAGRPLLQADAIELQRGAPSYSLHTVLLLRQQIPRDEPVFLCLGMDALCAINSWHRWQELLHHCHIVVSSRPGWQRPVSEKLADWIALHHCDDLVEMQQRPAGNLYFDDSTRLAISSSAIRNKVKNNQSIDFMTPDTVIHYIRQQHLYK